jgi:hypothetical protein
MAASWACVALRLSVLLSVEFMARIERMQMTADDAVDYCANAEKRAEQ